jgi:hypothetical protein
MSTRPAPIFSQHEHDPELRDAIDRFVVRLGERVDALQDAESARKLPELQLLAEDLCQRAERLGYPLLASLARTVARACGDDKPQLAQEALVELTEVSRRIRLGHRGAA